MHLHHHWITLLNAGQVMLCGAHAERYHPEIPFSAQPHSAKRTVARQFQDVAARRLIAGYGDRIATRLVEFLARRDRFFKGHDPKPPCVRTAIQLMTCVTADQSLQQPAVRASLAFHPVSDTPFKAPSCGPVKHQRVPVRHWAIP